MAALSGFHALLARINSTILTIGRNISWVLMVLMVFVILLQVFYRYVLNDALSWPEEAALSLMIWMMGLIAPSAYRWGGFVSIDMLTDRLSSLPRFILQMFLISVATIVTAVLLREAYTHYSSPILFNSSGLNRLVQDSGINDALGTNLEFRAAYIYLGMVVCFAVMLSVNIELLVRKIGQFVSGPELFPEPPAPDYLSAGAE